MISLIDINTSKYDKLSTIYKRITTDSIRNKLYWPAIDKSIKSSTLNLIFVDNLWNADSNSNDYIYAYTKENGLCLSKITSGSDEPSVVVIKSDLTLNPISSSNILIHSISHNIGISNDNCLQPSNANTNADDYLWYFNRLDDDFNAKCQTSVNSSNSTTFNCLSTHTSSSSVSGISTCGNGIVEADEECDRGKCCSSNCKYLDSATVCRESKHNQCDIGERCTGQSAEVSVSTSSFAVF